MENQCRFNDPFHGFCGEPALHHIPCSSSVNCPEWHYVCEKHASWAEGFDWAKRAEHDIFHVLRTQNQPEPLRYRIGECDGVGCEYPGWFEEAMASWFFHTDQLPATTN